MSNYSRLLQHLHRIEHDLPLETIQAALSHSLANSQPTPTSLAATAISSNLFLATPFKHANLQALQVAFRHAVHLKYALLDKPKTWSTTIFTRSSKYQMNLWVSDLLKGLQGGHAVMRLAAGNGIMLGLEDVKNGKDMDLAIRGKVEDEVIIAFAEAMDLYKYEVGEGSADINASTPVAEWEREFQKYDPNADSAITLCIVLTCHSLPLIPTKKLQTLPLASVSRILTSSIISAFRQGSFLESKDQVHPDGGPDTLLFHVIAPLSKAASLTLASLVDSRASDGLSVAISSLERLHQLCAKVETGMHKVLEPSTKADSWQILKTLLFSCVMITEAVLSSSLYLPPSAYSSVLPPVSTSPRADTVTPATLAFHTLQILGHLSYVVNQFGGVTSMGAPTEDGNASGVFKEMRKTFYLALDILSATAARVMQTRHLVESFINDLCRGVSLNNSTIDLARDLVPRQEGRLQLSKLSYALACIEQLVPVLSKECLMGDVWAIVESHLYLPEADPDTLKTLRETYEAAHSVVLSLFETNSNNHVNHLNSEDELSRFAERLVPFYAKCLIENSSDGKLSPVQLCMAFNALLRNASVAAAQDSDQDFQDDSDQPEKYTLAWYCISELVEAQKVLEAEMKSPGRAGVTVDENLAVARKEERLHRLRMAMMASLSAIPYVLLREYLAEVKRALSQAEAMGAQEETRKGEEKEQRVEGEAGLLLAGDDILSGAKRPPKKEELVQALYLEVMERVGDREKELVMGWWYENLDFLGRGLGNYKKGEAKSELLARRIVAGNEAATSLARL
ncbi:hypothetical protein AAF712_003158 [Marasmius tenuissimus]|uniref:Uncharacterized protein n=1 Tax=Marasmius tenuissimus TaxID=585030 RepID=A0ABR3AA46_9AGAR